MSGSPNTIHQDDDPGLELPVEVRRDIALLIGSLMSHTPTKASHDRIERYLTRCCVRIAASDGSES